MAGLCLCREVAALTSAVEVGLQQMGQMVGTSSAPTCLHGHKEQ